MAETLEGHIEKSLKKSLDDLEAATKKGGKVAEDEADKLIAELDRLTELLRNP